MRIAVLSGKGGTGKTFVSVNLASVIKDSIYLDCDVEEPNGRLFFQPEITKEIAAVSKIPVFDGEACVGCKKCVDFCAFHALIYIKEKPKVFTEVCHSCGGCMLLCPAAAISEEDKQIGVVEAGRGINGVPVITGILNVGESSGIPVIQKVLEEGDRIAAGKEEAVQIADCPPGSACSVMESAMEADYCILVTEPTAYGLHNLKMVYELVTVLGRKCGIVINKDEAPYEPLEAFCREKQLEVLARIPFSKEVAKLTADGRIASRELPEMEKEFTDLYHKVRGCVMS